MEAMATPAVPFRPRSAPRTSVTGCINSPALLAIPGRQQRGLGTWRHRRERTDGGFDQFPRQANWQAGRPEQHMIDAAESADHRKEADRSADQRGGWLCICRMADHPTDDQQGSPRPGMMGLSERFRGGWPTTSCNNDRQIQVSNKHDEEDDRKFNSSWDSRR